MLDLVARSVARASDLSARGKRFDSRTGYMLSWKSIMKSFSAVISPLPLIQEGQLSVTRMSYWRKYGHLLLVNRLGGLSLNRNIVVGSSRRDHSCIVDVK